MTPTELKRLRELLDAANHDCECGDCEWCEAKDDLIDSAVTALPALLDEVERLTLAAEGRARGCQCGDDDVCEMAKERDEARAEVRRLQAIESAAKAWRNIPVHIRPPLGDVIDAILRGEMP